MKTYMFELHVMNCMLAFRWYDQMELEAALLSQSFLEGGFGWRLPVVQTRSCAVIETLPSSDWEVAAASSVFFNI